MNSGSQLESAVHGPRIHGQQLLCWSQRCYRLTFVLLALVQAVLFFAAEASAPAAYAIGAQSSASEVAQWRTMRYLQQITCAQEGENGFRDAHHVSCAGWAGDDCSSAEYYTDAEVEEVRVNCPVCCGLQAPSPPSPPPSLPSPPKPPSPPPPTTCNDEANNGFVDVHGFPCVSWYSYDCHQTTYWYNAQQLAT
eukprot:7386519-Prymnesium_polylepis.1